MYTTACVGCHYSWRGVNKQLLSPDKEATEDQSKNTTQVHLDELISFIGVPHRNMNEELLARAERGQSELHHQISTPAQVMKPENTVQHGGSSTCWRV